MSNASVRATARALTLLFVATGSIIGAGSVAGSAASTTKALGLKRVAMVDLVGHGFGAGIGMGQWGAFGYAVKFHFGYEQILNHYYGQTVASSLPFSHVAANPTLRVAILENVNLVTNVGYDPVVTSIAPFAVTSAPTTALATTTTLPTSTSTSGTSTTVAPTTTVPTATTIAPTTATSGAPGSAAPMFTVPAGLAVDFRLQANGTWNAYEAATCTAALTPAATPVATGLVNPTAAAPLAPSTALLTLCRHDGVDEPLRGTIEAYDRSGFERTLNLVPLESYLDSVVPTEESVSWGADGGTVGAPQGQAWGFQALEAQAVAARSYTVANMLSGGWNGYADICDTTECEAYVGARYESPLSNAAVADTANEIRIAQPLGALAPSVVSTRFSASTGGWSAPGVFPTVRDRGDACVVAGNPFECNPNHAWTMTIPATAINRSFKPIGRLQRLHVSLRNQKGALGGRALEVVMSGTKGVMVVSGTQFAVALGIRSDWFAIAHLVRAGRPIVATPTTTTIATSTAPVVGAATGVSGPSGISGPGATSSSGSTGVTTTTLAPSKA